MEYLVWLTAQLVLPLAALVVVEFLLPMPKKGMWILNVIFSSIIPAIIIGKMAWDYEEINAGFVFMFAPVIGAMILPAIMNQRLFKRLAAASA